MTKEGRACGKVILFGEHAVVYGVPAIAAGIERGAVATAGAASGHCTLSVPDWNLFASEGDDGHPLARAWNALIEASDIRRPVHVVARASLPPGGGLGCSAAMGVAIARALDPDVSPDALQQRVFAWESVFHGNPSGIDAAVAARGGCVSFRRGHAPEPIALPRALKLCIGHTGIASATKTMVESVARLRERRPEVVDKTFAGIDSVVRNARLAIEGGDWRAVGQLMDMNQMLLGGLFVSTDEIERLCGAAREAGALGAKLTGAGGGGTVIALVADEAAAQAVLAAWERDGFSGFVTDVSKGSPAASGFAEVSP